MKRRPLVFVFLSLTSGVIIAGITGVKSPPIWSAAGTFALILVGSVAEYLNFDSSTWILSLGLILLGVILYGVHRFEPDNLYPRLRSLDSVKGKVASYPVKTESGGEISLNPSKYRGKLKIFLKSDEISELNYGDNIKIEGQFEVPPVFDDFNYREFLRKKKIWGVVYRGKVAKARRGFGNPLLELGWTMRKTISARIDGVLTNGSSFLKALLFGIRDVLSDTTKKSFTKTGLAHLLAASGLHLGIILGASWWVASKFGLGKDYTYLISLPLVFLYLTAVGFKLPLLRASLIYLFGGAHLWLKRTGIILDDWYDKYQALAGAALILVLINPENISTVGFQLSFGATFALALFFRPIKEALPRKPAYLQGIVAASLSAQLGVSPVLAVHFGQIHPWGPFVNVIAIPGVTAVLYLGIVAVIVGRGLVGFSALALLADRATFLFRRTIVIISNLPLARIKLPPPNALALAAYFILLCWLKIKLEASERNQLTEKGV